MSGTRSPPGARRLCRRQRLGLEISHPRRRNTSNVTRVSAERHRGRHGLSHRRPLPGRRGGTCVSAGQRLALLGRSPPDHASLQVTATTDSSLRAAVGPATSPDAARNAAKLNWLRAGMLGADDGIISTAGLILGVAAPRLSVPVTTAINPLHPGLTLLPWNTCSSGGPAGRTTSRMAMPPRATAERKRREPPRAGNRPCRRQPTRRSRRHMHRPGQDRCRRNPAAASRRDRRVRS